MGFNFNADNASSGGGGGGGSIAVYNEGILLTSAATSLNFIGADIEATGAGSAVSVYSPVPVFVSHFHTSDGLGVCTVADYAVTSRKIAGPTSEGTPYKLGAGWLAGSSQNATNSPSLTYSTVNPCSLFDNTTTDFTVTVYDADGTTVLATNAATNISADFTNTTSNITVTVSGFAVNSTKYQAVLSCSINIGAILPNGGRFSVKIEHDDAADGVFTKTQNNVFYDSNTNAAVLTGVAITETAGSVQVKELSGVQHYTLGSLFTVDVTDIDYLNDRSYPTTQVEIVAPNYGLAQLSLQGANLTGWTNAFDNTNASYFNALWELMQADYSYLGAAAKASARPIDWVAGAYVDSATDSVAIDTLSNNATRIYEDFRNETKRVTSAWAAWDNSQSLLTYDSNTGLQYSGSRLVYPQTDYTAYKPNPGSQPDYSGATGDRVSYTKFYKTSQSFSNGRIVFGDHNITEAVLTSGDVLLEISLNGTDYFSLNSLYVGGVIVNGDGCRINDDTHGFSGATVNDSSIEFTFGTGKFTDGTTGAGPEFWGAVLRVTFKDTVTGKAAYIGSLQLINWA